MDIKQKFDTLEDLKTERSYQHNLWQELSESFEPGSQDFTRSVYGVPWEEINRAIEPKGKYLHQRLVSMLFGQLFNPGTKWMEFKTDDELTDLQKEDLDNLNKNYLKILNKNKTQLSVTLTSAISSSVIYGSGFAVRVLDLTGKLYYKHIPLSQCYISTDYNGQVDTFFREFEMTAKQLIQEFGIEKVSDKVLKIAEKKPETKVKVIHCITPNLKVNKKKKENFEHCYIECETKHILDFKYIERNPVFRFLWARHADEKYGHGQGKLALSNIRRCTAIRRESTKSLEMANNPALFLGDDDMDYDTDMAPGDRFYGAFDEMTGQPKVQPFTGGSNPQAGLQAYQLELENLTDIFFVNDITQPVDSTRRTAYESNLINQDRNRFIPQFINRMIPTLEQLVEDGLISTIEVGLLDLPESLKEIELEAHFLSPMAKLFKLEDTVAIQNFLQSILPLAQVDERILAKYDLESIAELAREGYGAPQSIVKSDSQLEAEKQAIQAQQQQEVQMQSALASSEVSKNLGQANKFNSEV